MRKRKSLLGMFQSQPDAMASLLGQYYDPSTARQKWLGGTLQGLGMGLASGQPGAWAQGLATGGGDALEEYQQEALLGYRMNTEAEDRSYRRGRDAKADAWANTERQWAMEDRERESETRRRQDEARANAFNTLPQEMRPYAKAFPEMVPDYIRNQMMPESAPGLKSYAPIPYDMGNGQIGYGIPMEDGTFRPVETPEGGQFLSPYEKAYQTNAGATRGKTVTEQQLAASSDVAAADQALDLIRQIEQHPGLDWGTGIWSLGNIVPGTAGYDFQNLVEQTKSGAFLTAIDQLRGMGALSNMEGQAATAAVTRINAATSKEAFLKALDDYRKRVEAGRMRAAARSGGAQPQQAIPAPPGLSQFGATFTAEQIAAAKARWGVRTDAEAIQKLRQNMPAAPTGVRRYNPQTGEIE